MNLHSIILKENVPVDPRKYGAILAPLLGITVLEAKMAVRRGGIVAEDLAEEDARRLADTLEADGIACWCVPASALPPLPAARRVTALKSLPEGIRAVLQGQSGSALIPWDQISVLSVGLVLVPELQPEIAGVRKKDVASIARLEQEERDLTRDRLLALLTRVDLAPDEKAPASGSRHYFLDQLRRRESMQMKAFVDVVSAGGADWWRVPLEEAGYTDGEGGPTAMNVQVVPLLHERRKEAHTERSRDLLHGGDVERLAFHTMEEFNRYTRWWTWKELLKVRPELAEAPALPASNGNGHVDPAIAAAPYPIEERIEAPRPKWLKATLIAVLLLVVGLSAGFRFERRGTLCILCQKLRNDDVLRLWGYPIKETPGEWNRTTAKGPYEEIINREHSHLYEGFGYEQEGLFGLAKKSGRAPGGNASPEELDAAVCVTSLLMWHSTGQASFEEVRDAYPKLFERVRRIKDPAERRTWLDLANAQPNRETPGNLLEVLAK